MNKYYLEIQIPASKIKEVEVIAQNVIADGALTFYNTRLCPCRGFWNWIRRRKYEEEYTDIAIYPLRYTIVRRIHYDYELDE